MVKPGIAPLRTSAEPLRTFALKNKMPNFTLNLFPLKKRWKPIKFSLIAALTAFLISACNANSGTIANPSQPQAGAQLVKHSLGETRVPENPQRIIALDPNSLEALLALGIKPVAAAGFSNDLLFPTYLNSKINGIEVLGTIEQPSMEKIVLSKPDLMVGQEQLIKQTYDTLQQIAPTVSTGHNSFYRWEDQIQLVGEVVGKEQEAKQLLENYQQRINKFKAAMGDRIPKTTVSVVQIYEDSAWVFTGSRTGNSVLEDIGFPLPNEQKKLKDPGYGVSISLESLSVLDADVMFLSYFPEKSKTVASKYLKNPLWSQLKAVKNKQVYEVGGDYWGSGSIEAANLVLDDLFKYLVEGGDAKKAVGKN